LAALLDMVRRLARCQHQVHGHSRFGPSPLSDGSDVCTSLEEKEAESGCREEDWDEGDEWAIDEDVYGAAIYTLIHDGEEILSGRDVLGHRTNVVRCILVAATLVANFGLQFMLLWWSFHLVVRPLVYSAQRLYQQFHQDCFTDGTFDHHKWHKFPEQEELCNIAMSQNGFLAAILWIWVLYMLEELRKIERQARIFFGIRSAQNASDMIKVYPDGKEKVVRLTAMVRIALVLVLIIPKLVITILLTLIGFVWLTATVSFADLILNAVALAFIIQIDEQIYNVLIPDNLKSRMAQTVLWTSRTAQNTQDVAIEVRWGLLKAFFLIVCSLFLVALYIGPGQQLIPIFPGFKNDIDKHCKAFRARKPMCEVGESGDCFPMG